MSDDKVYPVSEAAAANTLLTREQYEEMYARSIESPDEFWAEQAEKNIHWFSPWDQVSELSLIHISEPTRPY